jgi:hypothetical protein
VRRNRAAMLDVLRHIEEKFHFSGTGEPFSFREEGDQALRDRYSEEEINYALYLLIDAKLVEGSARVTMHSGFKGGRVLAITNLGHDYLERTRSDDGFPASMGYDGKQVRDVVEFFSQRPSDMPVFIHEAGTLGCQMQGNDLFVSIDDPEDAGS